MRYFVKREQVFLSIIWVFAEWTKVQISADMKLAAPPIFLVRHVQPAASSPDTHGHARSFQLARWLDDSPGKPHISAQGALQSPTVVHTFDWRHWWRNPQVPGEATNQRPDSWENPLLHHRTTSRWNWQPEVNSSIYTINEIAALAHSQCCYLNTCCLHVRTTAYRQRPRSPSIITPGWDNGISWFVSVSLITHTHSRHCVQYMHNNLYYSGLQ